MLAALGRRAGLALLTNKPIDATRTILSGLGLARFFDGPAVIGGDGPHGRKPDPAGLRYLCDRAGVPAAQALLVGDSRVDLRTARALGAALCLARYGFGFDSISPEDIERAECVIDRPTDLLTVYG